MLDRATLQVLADRSLFQSIVGFAPGIPFFALHVKRQLKCAQPGAAVLHGSYYSLSSRSCIPPEDIALWQNAVSTGDKYTLEALHALASLESDVGRQMRGVLRGVFSYALTLAMDTRNTSLLDWIHASGLFPFDKPNHAVLYTLGFRGDLQMLRLLYDNGHFIDRGVANGAASRGHLNVLQFLQCIGSVNAIIDGAATACAAANGHLHVLEFLMEQQTEWDISQRWITDGYSRAIAGGHLHVVQYLHENGFECGEYDIDKAAANGHLDVVKYLHENQIGNKGDSALTSALTNRHLEVVKFLLANGWTYHIMNAEDLVKNDELEIPQLLCERGSDSDIEDALRLALKHHSIKFVKFLYAFNPTACARQGSNLAAQAAENGFLDFIEFFHACGDPEFFDSRAMEAAAVNGHLDIVRFLHENRDEPFYISTLREAFKRGHHQVVDYLCENRPVEENPSLDAFYEQYGGFEELVEKIERGAAAARAAGRKLYRYYPIE